MNAVTSYPGDNTTYPNQYTSRLNGWCKKIGAAITLKVFAGDQADLAVQYWYPQYSDLEDDNPVPPDNLLSVLISDLCGDASALGGGKATVQQLSQPATIPWVLGNFFASQDNQPNTAGQPEAFLNRILADEQFEFVPGVSGCTRRVQT